MAAEDEEEPAAKKPWPKHDREAAEARRQEPGPWLEGFTMPNAPREAKPSVLPRAFPQLVRTPPAKAAEPLSAREVAELEAKFEQTRRRRKALLRGALLAVWGALVAAAIALWLFLK